MSKAQLAKLTAKGVNLNALGGNPTLTWQDVAFALAGLSEEIHLFARAAYIGSHSDVDRFVKLASSKYMQSKELVTAALFEVAYRTRCNKCSGLGEAGASSCDKCLGTGIAPMSDRQRAANCGRSRSYYEVRRSSYQLLLESFSEHDFRLKCHLSKKLGDVA